MTCEERLIRYAKIDTQSARFAGKWPTTDKQFDLARELFREMTELGLSDVYLDEEHCVVCGRVPGNVLEAEDDPLGLIAHMDTAPDAPGGAKPWVLRGYDGGDIVLNEEKGIVMRAADYPNLRQYIGQDLVLTDGTTLLGGDDKASIAAMMTLAEYLLAHPEVKHRPVAMAFTPDEEVGGLAKDLDLARFGAPTAYTLDGDHLGWYEDETFNASEAVVTFAGVSVHTGTAKGIMKNACDMAAAFMGMLPANEKPQTTEGREGFYHVVSCEASCEKAVVHLIIRDHDAGKFAAREAFVRACADTFNETYGPGTASCAIHEQYRNMREVIDTVPELVTRLVEAIRAAGIEPVCEPFRGGTDGAALSFRGLPCPNLSAGYENAHGRFEYVPVRSMEKNVEILLNLAGVISGS